MEKEDLETLVEARAASLRKAARKTVTAMKIRCCSVVPHGPHGTGEVLSGRGSKRIPISEAVWGSVTVSQLAQGGSQGPVKGSLWPGQKVRLAV